MDEISIFLRFAFQAYFCYTEWTYGDQSALRRGKEAPAAGSEQTEDNDKTYEIQ
jgi:hypothetical protein